MKRNYAFIDAQNVNISVQNQGWKMDWKKFRQHLTSVYTIHKAYLFLGFMPEYQHMYDFLQESGYDLIFKPVHIIRNKATKGNVDAELVLQAMIEYKHYDEAVIVSGDGDFACLVDHLYTHGKLLRLLVPNSKQFSLFLKHVAKEKIDSLSDLQQELQFVASDPLIASLDTDAAIDLIPPRSPLKYLGAKIKQLLKKPQEKVKINIPHSVRTKPVQTPILTSKKPFKKEVPNRKSVPQQSLKKSSPQPNGVQQSVRAPKVSKLPVRSRRKKSSPQRYKSDFLE